MGKSSDITQINACAFLARISITWSSNHATRGIESLRNCDLFILPPSAEIPRRAIPQFFWWVGKVSQAGKLFVGPILPPQLPDPCSNLTWTSFLMTWNGGRVRIYLLSHHCPRLLTCALDRTPPISAQFLQFK